MAAVTSGLAGGSFPTARFAVVAGPAPRRNRHCARKGYSFRAFIVVAGIVNTSSAAGKKTRKPDAVWAQLTLSERGHSCPMPLGFERQTTLIGCGYPPVPEGQTTIAQRFNAG